MNPNKAKALRPMHLDIDLSNGVRAALLASDNPAARYVGEHGTEWKGSEVICDPKGPEGCCYSNARNHLLRNYIGVPKYRYVEGWSESRKFHNLLIRHGWLVDNDGTPIDVTWYQPDITYIGVVFDNPPPPNRSLLGQAITEEWVLNGDRTDPRRIQKSWAPDRWADVTPNGLTHIINGTHHHIDGPALALCGLNVGIWTDPFTDEDCDGRLCLRCRNRSNKLGLDVA